MLAFYPNMQYTNRCLLKWLKLWDTVVFGKENAVKKAKPSAEAHPPFNQPKEQQNKWKTKVQLTEEILEAELDQHKRPKYKVSRTGGHRGGSPLQSPSSHHHSEEQSLPEIQDKLDSLIVLRERGVLSFLLLLLLG